MTPHYLILNNHNKQKEKSNKIVNEKYGLIYSILFTNYYNTRIETHPSLGLISKKMGIKITRSRPKGGSQDRISVKFQ